MSSSSTQGKQQYQGLSELESLDTQPETTPQEKLALEEREQEWGTIFVQGREQALGGVEQARSTYWTEADEEAYLKRVKEKAVAMATEIIEKANGEAQAIQDAARNEGYNEGLNKAEEELAQFRAEMAESVASILSSIEEQGQSVFAKCGEDFLALCRLSIEKIAGGLVFEEKEKILAALLKQSLALMEQHRLLTIYVNPEDEALIYDVIATTKEHYPDIGTWQVRADASLSPGSLLLENESSLAKTLPESRLAAINEAWEKISLPEVL